MVGLFYNLCLAVKKHLWKYILVLVLVVAVNDAACVLLGPRRGGTCERGRQGGSESCPAIRCAPW